VGHALGSSSPGCDEGSNDGGAGRGRRRSGEGSTRPSGGFLEQIACAPGLPGQSRRGQEGTVHAHCQSRCRRRPSGQIGRSQGPPAQLQCRRHPCGERRRRRRESRRRQGHPEASRGGGGGAGVGGDGIPDGRALEKAVLGSPSGGSAGSWRGTRLCVRGGVTRGQGGSAPAGMEEAALVDPGLGATVICAQVEVGREGK
jgi:hypothetical protein